MDWSTSYQAGSSSSQAGESTDDSDTDVDLPMRTSRGRKFSSASSNPHRSSMSSANFRAASPHQNSSGESSGGYRRSTARAPFTRSRSPAINPSFASHRHASPAGSPFARNKFIPLDYRSLLPAIFELHLPIAFTSYTWTVSLDARRAGECLIIIASLIYATSKIWEDTNFYSPHFISRQFNLWVVTETHTLAGASILYMLWVHNSIISSKSTDTSRPVVQPQNPSVSRRPGSPRIFDGREQRRTQTLIPRKKIDFGYVWMTVPKNYRDSSDDGIFTGLLFGPLVSATLLYHSLSLSPSSDPLPPGWRIEPPNTLSNARGHYTALEALILSRYNLVDLANLCSTVFLLHVCASWWLEGRYRGGASNVLDAERRSVPRSEIRRLTYFALFTLGTSLTMVALRLGLEVASLGIWQHLSYLEVAVISSFFQCTLYGAVRLAHRGFTLGELGMVAFGGTAMFMEFLNFTKAKIWPLTTPFIKTFRLPTPLLIFQTALVAGSLLTGFALSPLLVLSRSIAQRPVRRMKNPEQKLRYRRLLALGFYVGAVVIVAGVIGTWTCWCLGQRNPWLWVIFWLLEGRKKWSRPALLVYWGLLGSLSVAGWTRQLARSRRFRAWNNTGENLIVPGAGTTGTNVLESTSSSPGTGSGDLPPVAPLSGQLPTVPLSPTSSTTSGVSGALGLTFPNLPNLPQLPNGATVATDLLDAADKHVPTLRLNARRKFFHALTVVMFVPGVAFDPAFTHLCFSAAFALFTFTEYVRYFAIYPFGAAVHLFMNEFLDHKDSGTAILSHFYLLTGCAGSLWLEGRSSLVKFTGILVLGVGDALASVVGKRIGIHRWSPTTSKTVEGSFAYTASIVICAWILRLFGMVESFSTFRYASVIGISSVLEALSDQNDNLTLPLFTWSLLMLMGC
ncbi:hypothetical protein K435DRAFT_748744 [Dendrothele bispora CBS 962.96]|uniref:dolichol kinase n=1 Tax=Dendrothele bispora (strain CBS 962.96) TaxID=1314807 RepID=A0A4S8MJ89_DENBC|nr:hypothetical protein K435DRAFT_748744 [Dendrothele bispora CBS 962.96]